MKPRRSAWLRVLGLLVVALANGQCLPECNQVVVDYNPYGSNLVDYTLPESGAIMGTSELQTLTVLFSEAVDRTSFSLQDDVRVRLILNYWEVDDSDDWQTQEVAAGEYFTGEPAWACEELPECLPGEQFAPVAATRLVLTVDPAARDLTAHHLSPLIFKQLTIRIFGPALRVGG